MKDNEVRCLLCDGIAELKYKKFPGYQKPDFFKIYHCSFCNTAFSLPRVGSGKLYDIIYKHGDKVPGYDRYWKYLKEIRNCKTPLEYLANSEETYWAITEALLHSGKYKKITKILEIGSGLGYLTFALNAEKYDAIGIDVSETAVNHSIENFGNHYYCTDITEYSKNYPGSIDIIIATEVIEHLENPLEFVDNIIKILKPDGQAFITTPNKSFYSKELIWVSDLPPIHYWWFGEESFICIANRLNLKVSFIDFSGFYKNNKLYKITSVTPEKFPHPILNEDGELLNIEEGKNYTIKSFIISILAKIPFAKVAYRKLRMSINSHLSKCGIRGIVLCIVIERQ